MVVCQDLKLKAIRDIAAFQSEKAAIAKSLRNIGEAFDNDIIEKHPDVEPSAQVDIEKLNLLNGELTILIE